MQDRPSVRTAIPKHRYRIGAHQVALLGEVESGDARVYRYILAFVRAGSPQPELYVCAEESPPGERAAGTYRLRVIGEALSELVDTDDRWGDLETFAEQALKLGAQALGLSRERVERLA